MIDQESSRTVHEYPFTRDSIRGYFDRSDVPVLTVDPGDTVRYQTLDASWGDIPAELGGTPQPFAVKGPPDPAHALCGPIAIRGAEPGDVLAVRIGEVRPARFGWTWAGPRPDNPRYEMGITRRTMVTWEIDLASGRAFARSLGISRPHEGFEFPSGADGPGLARSRGISVPLRPFMGIMGNAPAEGGRHLTAPPRRVGGNIDCRELTSGTTLFLPVEVEGALFYVGDGHAAQGDGEVGGSAIECRMDVVELTFRLEKARALRAPEAETPDGYVTLGFGASLDAAATVALESMLEHLERELTLERAEVMALASVTVSLRVTQVVNGGVVGVHALLPHGLQTGVGN